MEENKNNVSDNTEDLVAADENGGKKKKINKKATIIIVAVVVAIAIVAGVIAGVKSGDKEKHTEKAVSSSQGESQSGESPKPGIINGEIIAPTKENGNSSSGGGSSNSPDSNSGGNSGNGSDSNSGGGNGNENGGGNNSNNNEIVPVDRKLHIEIILPNDGSNEDVLYVYINGEQIDLSGGTRRDAGYVVKTDGSVFAFDTEKEYKGAVNLEVSLKNYSQKPTTHTTGINDTIVKISLPLNRSEEGYYEF